MRQLLLHAAYIELAQTDEGERGGRREKRKREEGQVRYCEGESGTGPILRGEKAGQVRYC
jgi:hypothetical protein